jgi:hypothetical protein
VPEWYRIGLHTEGRTSFLPEYRVGKDQIGQVLIEHVENSDNFTRKTQLMASDKLAAMRPVFDFIASQYAAIITPSVPDEAPVGLESTGSHVFCAMWSVSDKLCTNLTMTNDRVGPSCPSPECARLQG